MDEADKLKANIMTYVKSLKEKRAKVKEAADRVDIIRQVRREQPNPSP
ncbi:hypothetical protein LCGC14_1855050 [marine sediment metagenome]|uniref:Uncharacterized protein n=1 Tax=marine sediment metagenome TaxID=412755 RepID=A0A0F9G9N2_9ZZZZ